MGETCIKVAGEWKYLYRAIDRDRDTIDFLLRAKRGGAAARHFLERPINLTGVPEKITIDKSGANTAAIKSEWRSLGLSATDDAASASSAMMPPSPWLLARMMRVTYLSVTTTMSDQKISETMPIRLPGVKVSPLAGSKTVCMTYSGLVPMSPKTTPSAPQGQGPTVGRFRSIGHGKPPQVHSLGRRLQHRTIVRERTEMQ